MNNSQSQERSAVAGHPLAQPQIWDSEVFMLVPDTSIWLQIADPRVKPRG